MGFLDGVVLLGIPAWKSCIGLLHRMPALCLALMYGILVWDSCKGFLSRLPVLYSGMCTSLVPNFSSQPEGDRARKKDGTNFGDSKNFDFW